MEVERGWINPIMHVGFQVSTSHTASLDSAPQFERTAPTSSATSDAFNIALTVGSRLVYAASQAAVLVLIARLGGTQDTALFIWAMALTAPVFMFTNLNLSELISTETAHGYHVRDYWSVRLLSTAGGLAMLMAIVPLVAPTHEWLIIAAVATGKALESINDLVLGAYHRCDRADRAAISLITRRVGGCLCLAAVRAMTSNVMAGVTGMILFQFLSLVIYDAPYIGQFGNRNMLNTRTSVVSIMRMAFPLGVVACLTSLSLNVPRYTVHGHLDDHSLAAFGCCASFLQVFSLVGVATQLALSPRIASQNAHSRRLMNAMLWRNVAGVACIGTLVAIAAHVWGPMVLATTYGQQFVDFGPVLTWLMVAGVFSAAKGFLATGLTATRSTLSQASFAAAQFACSAVGCLWLVPRHGVIAAAWVVAASSAVSFALHAIWTVATAREATAT